MRDDRISHRNWERIIVSGGGCSQKGGKRQSSRQATFPHPLRRDNLRQDATASFKAETRGPEEQVRLMWLTDAIDIKMDVGPAARVLESSSQLSNYSLGSPYASQTVRVAIPALICPAKRRIYNAKLHSRFNFPWKSSLEKITFTPYSTDFRLILRSKN